MGFGRLLRLGFVAVPLVLFGVLVAMLVTSRRSHGHWRPNSPGELLLRAEVVPRRPMAPPAKLHWRRYPDHCLGISGDPSAEHGRLLKLVDCANGTLLLVEEAVYNELGVGTG